MPAQKRPRIIYTFNSDKNKTFGSNKGRTNMAKATGRKVNKSTAVKAYENMLANPFTAKAAHLPDKYTGVSNALVIEETHTITTNSTGSFAFYMGPDLTNFYRLDTVDASGIVTTGTLQSHHDYNDTEGLLLSTHCHKYRVLGLAVEVSYIGRADDRSGVLRYYMSAGSSPDDTAQWASDAGITGEERLTEGKLVVKSHLYDRPGFQAMSSNFNNFLQNIRIAGVNLPASEACILVRSVMHIEAIAKTNSILALTQRPSPTADNVPPSNSAATMQS